MPTGSFKWIQIKKNDLLQISFVPPEVCSSTTVIEEITLQWPFLSNAEAPLYDLNSRYDVGKMHRIKTQGWQADGEAGRSLCKSSE